MTRKQKKMLFRILAAGGMMLGFHFVPVQGIWRFLLYLIPYFLIGYDILYDAVRGIWNGQLFDENFLMAVATVGALVIGLTRTGDYVEAVAVMLFYQTGELFQSYAVGKSRRNISALMDIRPDYANVMQNGTLQRGDPDTVAVGSQIVVQPGEKVPLDGVVVEGASTLNTAALTGESIPRDVVPGDNILSGCINMTGMLTVRTTREFGESTVSRILDLVENASARKSRSENFISKFAKVYTPAVCMAALALAVLPPFIIGLATGDFSGWIDWIYRALTFLVISCPCALVISVPLSFFAGIGGAGKEGILIKGSNYLEALSQVETVVFDKTGTLTQGVFEVTRICAVAMSPEQLLEYAALAESASSHPISKSLQQACGRSLDRQRVQDIQEYSGHGVTALADGTAVAVGNGKLLQQLCIPVPETEDAGTVIHVAVDGCYAGYILICDVVKPTAAEALRGLKAAGIRKTVMLTGDSAAAAEKAARELGLDTWYSQLLPGDKVEKVEQLLQGQRRREKLAFVGDGINDAPVLSRADIGIAMGAMGSDAAIEAADVVLMDDDPKKLVTAIRIARKCMEIVYQNIVFAIGVKVACLVLGALGVAGLWLAIFADVGVMVLAVLNAIRALFIRRM